MLQRILEAVQHLNPTVYTAPTGSVYISLECKKVKTIRIANHKGHKLKNRVWELRSDAMTSRSKTSRVYNKNSITLMINDLKKLEKI